MALSEPLRITLLVARALEQIEVPYLLGGSLASSLHGIPRSTQDADLVADLQPRHAGPLVSLLKEDFYIDEERVRDAVRRRASFNMIHLKTMTKVDIFVLKATPLSREEMQRRDRISLPGGDGESLYVASAEDTILQKLIWSELGGGLSERQWNDILGVLKVQRGRLDLDYLRLWAVDAGVGELLQRALNEVNADHGPTNENSLATPAGGN